MEAGGPILVPARSFQYWQVGMNERGLVSAYQEVYSRTVSAGASHNMVRCRDLQPIPPILAIQPRHD
jgi:hypothetical protein